jgi:hypothetical protein
MLVSIEKTKRGYRASSGKPLEADVEAATREEALSQLRAALTERLRSGVELVDLALPGAEQRPENPWLRIAGIFQEDPLFDEWQASIAENRHREEESASHLPNP